MTSIMMITRYCKKCDSAETMPMCINWTDEALEDGTAAEYYENYTCNKCNER